MKTQKIAAAAVMAAIGLFSAAAQSATVICPNTLTITDDREHELTTADASTCLAYGNGNLQGAVGQESNDFFTAGVGSAYTILDKDEPNDTNTALPGIESLFQVTGIGGKSASFMIDPSLWATYSSLVIGFTAGDGQIDNRWAVFGLAANTLSGTWTSSPDKAGGLSHAVLYGIKGSNNVPEPASLALMGIGLLGMGAVRRVKQGKKA